MNSAHQLLTTLREGDFWSLLLASLALLFVGQRLIERRPTLHSAAAVGGLLGFLTVVGADIVEAGIPDADGMPGLLWQALLAGGFSFALATFVLPLTVLVWDWSLGIPLRVVRNVFRSGRIRREQRRQTRISREENARRREQAAEEGQRRRRQQVLDADERRLAERAEADANQRRSRVRFECQLAFDQNRTALLDVFPEKLLATYFEQYLADCVPVEQVEQRGRDLQQMFDTHLRRTGVSEAPQFESIEEIVASFAERRRRLAAAFEQNTEEGAADIVATLQTQLSRLQEQAIREFLK